MNGPEVYNHHHQGQAHGQPKQQHPGQYMAPWSRYGPPTYVGTSQSPGKGGQAPHNGGYAGPGSGTVSWWPNYSARLG
jgi:hypothetical protein